MSTPEPLTVPATISQEAFGAALEFLGIPVQGSDLMALDWEPSRLTLVYKRRDADGRTMGTVCDGKAAVAKQRFDIAVLPSPDEVPAHSIAMGAARQMLDYIRQQSIVVTLDGEEIASFNGGTPA